jgi:hypothetical protein
MEVILMHLCNCMHIRIPSTIEGIEAFKLYNTAHLSNFNHSTTVPCHSWFYVDTGCIADISAILTASILKENGMIPIMAEVQSASTCTTVLKEKPRPAWNNFDVRASGHSSWLQIQRSRVRFPFWEVMGLERGPLSLMMMTDSTDSPMRKCIFCGISRPTEERSQPFPFIFASIHSDQPRSTNELSRKHTK